MKVVDVTDTLQATLRAERDALVSRHLERRSRASTVPSSASQKEIGAVFRDPAPASGPPSNKKWTTKLMHPTWHLLADICPQCGFPEACAGYCPECGWSLPHPFKK